MSASRKTDSLPAVPARQMLQAAGLSYEDADALIEDAKDFTGPSSVTAEGVRYTVTEGELDMFLVVIQG